MKAHWNVSNNFLEIAEMPFYWRLSDVSVAPEGIMPRLGITIIQDKQYDYLKFQPSLEQWGVINAAYKEDANIGFLNPESGQLNTYGSSVNNFFLNEIKRYSPRRTIEIGCGAGFSIQFLKEYGFDVIGVDPSEYSLRWSEKLGFKLINDFFTDNVLEFRPNFIYCNDVFEHICEAKEFASVVFNCLADNGVFCFATTNSTESIRLGDISMLEHQHVNMFTDRSIYLILARAGFSDISVNKGSYGNTFHVTAIKRVDSRSCRNEKLEVVEEQPSLCEGFFRRAAKCISHFEEYYQSRPVEHHNFYVPLRCIPYLACVGDFGDSRVFDSNSTWRGKFIDGYRCPIGGVGDISHRENDLFFIGSLTFFEEIKKTLMSKGFPAEAISSIEHLL
jgi:SAM-dependent methyltransferase